MNIMNQKTKQKIVIRTLLCCFRGMKFTASDISQFIIRNKLYNKETHMSPVTVYSLINEEKKNGRCILNDVKKEKIGEIYYYWMDELDDMVTA